MRIRVLFAILFLAAFVTVAYGASCPYCGRTYGEGGRRDRAYIERIRAEHEANCPSRFQKSSAPTPSTPSYDYEAERQRQENAEKEWQKKQEEERAKQEADEKKRQEEFERKKQEALNLMKGTGIGGGIKDRNTPIFGLKGVGDTGIRDIKPRSGLSPGNTAWKQLHCAVEIKQYINRAARQGDIDELVYLTGEAVKALNGESIGVTCSEAPPPPKIKGKGAEDNEKALMMLKKVLEKVAGKADKIKNADRAITELKEKENKAKAQIEDVKSQSAKTSKGPDDDVIAKAYAEQKDYQAKEQKKIEEVYKKQKENESVLEEAMAALKDAQKLINQKNAEKSKLFSEINRDLNKADTLMSGQGQVARKGRRTR